MKVVLSYLVLRTQLCHHNREYIICIIKNLRMYPYLLLGFCVFCLLFLFYFLNIKEILILKQVLHPHDILSLCTYSNVGEMFIYKYPAAK